MTHLKIAILTAFPQQKYLHERVSLLIRPLPVLLTHAKLLCVSDEGRAVDVLTKPPAVSPVAQARSHCLHFPACQTLSPETEGTKVPHIRHATSLVSQLRSPFIPLLLQRYGSELWADRHNEWHGRHLEADNHSKILSALPPPQIPPPLSFTTKWLRLQDTGVLT